VEGLHLLNPVSEWAKAQALFDLVIHLDCDREDNKQRVLERKIKNGTPEDQARATFPSLDRMADEVEAGMDQASAVLKFKSSKGEGQYVLESMRLRDDFKAPSLLAVGLNPAFQKTLRFQKLAVGDVNRAQGVSYSCGGKGQHVAIAANRMGEGCVSIAHFLGKESDQGMFINETLKERGIEQVIEWIPGKTRTCTTLLDQSTKQMTELIEPSETVPDECVEAMMTKALESARSCKGVALCGTFPPGVGEQVYAAVARCLPKRAILLLDGFKGVNATLQTKRVDVLKINSDELVALIGEQDLDEAAKDCLQMYLPEKACLAVTRGSSSAILYTQPRIREFHATEFQIPKIEAVNPIGAGDTCSAGLLYALAAGHEQEEAFAWGLACATASCLYLEGANFKLSKALEFFLEIAKTANHRTF